jgi:hypothetical protein
MGHSMRIAGVYLFNPTEGREYGESFSLPV